MSFDGTFLAGVSSNARGKTRWIELELFKTDAGMYVLHGIGKSIVSGEVDRHWVQLADNPEGIIDRLYLFNDLGAKYIPRTSVKLITDACERDEAIKLAWHSTHVA